MGYKKANKQVYTLNSLSSNLASNSTYYFGNMAALGATGTSGLRRIYFPCNGTIRAVYLHIYADNDGTEEDTTIVIRKNNTTDYALYTGTFGTQYSMYVNIDDLAIPIAKGDFIEFKITTPNWVTPPTGNRFCGSLLFNY